MDLKELTSVVKQELADREYSQVDQALFIREWKRLSEWMETKKITEFTEQTGVSYCDDVLGNHIIDDNFAESMKRRLRAIRLLMSYQKNGEFELRTPRKGREIIYTGPVGDIVTKFLDEKKSEGLSFRTLDNKRRYLYDFYMYLSNHDIPLSEITVNVIDDYFLLEQYSAEKRYRVASAVRDFLRYCYYENIIPHDASVFVESGKYNKRISFPLHTTRMR